MSEPIHMDNDDFNPRYDVSLSPGDAAGEVRLIFAGADERHAVTATREEMLRLAAFIQRELDPPPPPKGAKFLITISTEFSAVPDMTIDEAVQTIMGEDRDAAGETVVEGR